MIDVIRGFSNSSHTALNDVMQFSNDSSVWTSIVYSGSFTLRAVHAVLYYSNTIYVHCEVTAWWNSNALI